MSGVPANFARQGKKCVAIGRNYMNHVKELGNTAPKEPFFFLKPTSSYLANGGTVELPKGENIHHEVELGVVIGKTARNVRAADAMKHVAGYNLAIDMSRSRRRVSRGQPSRALTPSAPSLTSSPRMRSRTRRICDSGSRLMEMSSKTATQTT